MPVGEGSWQLKARNSKGEGPTSEKNFNVITSLPTQALLVGPAGTITDFTPTYTWNAVPNSTWYYLWVDDSSGNKIKQWYTAEQAGCASGTGICSITPTTALVNGAGTWWIQTWNSEGYGPWSSGMGFTVSIVAPTTALLDSPLGIEFDTTPTYTWHAVSNSTWYYLWVDDSGGNKIKQWYTAEQAGCASGTGICSITPTSELASGSCNWWIQTWNSAGYGPWSSFNPFEIIP